MTAASLYPLMAIIGVLVTSAIWSHMLPRDSAEARVSMPFIYLAGLAGAFIGAKLVYIGAEGWMRLMDPALTSQEKLLDLLTGKTITGALLGGYAGVEWAKRQVGHRAPTGDFFAVIAPVGLMFGRTGCWLHGCCAGVMMDAAWYTMVDAEGVHRWPAVPVEFGFNAVMAVFAGVCMARGIFKNQLFHVYLIAYGAFRLAHEFLRDTPPLVMSISGYQLAAVALILLGGIRYYQREMSEA